MNFTEQKPQEQLKCREYHGIEGKLPTKEDVHFDGKTCDCGKIIFYAEMCGCSTPHLELKSKPNENYIPQ